MRRSDKLGWPAIALAVALSCAPAPARAQSDDTMILLPPSPGDDESPQKKLGQTLLPLVVDCLNAEPLHPEARQAKLAIFEYADGIGFPAASVAQSFIAPSGKAEIGQRAPYTLVMVVSEKKSESNGQYTNGALVYSSTFEYCLIDMPARTVTAKDTFLARPPKEIEKDSNTYSELRRLLADFIAGLPVAKAPSPNH